MIGMAFIAAAGIFVVGIVVGIIVVVSHGVRQEEARFREMRRFQEEHGLWDSLEGPGHYLPEQTSGGTSLVARRLNGLHVRHLPTSSRQNAQFNSRV